VLSQLEEMGLRPVRELVSRILDYAFIPSPIPPELLEQVTRIEGVRMVHKSMPRAAGGMTTRPPRVPLFATVFDELLGEVGVPGIVTPPEAVPEILPGPASLLKALGNLAYPFAGVNPLVNIRVFTTSDTFGIVKDRPTRDGEGVRVAVLDTGSPAHTPEHLGNLSKLEEHTVIPEPPQDGHSHGSWCHNAVCGAYGLSPYGPLVGGAPAVERSIHVKCLNTFPGTGSTEGVLKAIEIAVNRGARLLSMSLGGPAQGDSVEGDVECRIVNELSERGVIFAIAAGNSGHDPWTVGAPGVALKSVCCASASVMDDFAPAHWSSRGPGSEWDGEHQGEWRSLLARHGGELIKPDCSCLGGGRAVSGSQPDEIIWSGASGWFEGFYDGIKDLTGGMHGCIRADAIIPTFEEPRYLDDIEEGDVIPTFNGFGISPARVVRKWRTGVKPVYRIRTRNKELYATLNHPLLVLIGGRLAWMAIGDLMRYKDKVAVAIVKKLPSNAKRGIGEGLARWLGYFLGDGWVTEVGGCSYIVYLAADDKGKVNYYLELGAKLFGAKWRKHMGYWRFCSKSAGELLVELGLKRPAREKTIPDWVFTLPANEKLAFVQGYIDADGYVRDGAVAFECGGKDLIIKLWILLQQLGFTSLSRPYKRRRISKPPNSKAPKEVETYCLYVRNGLKYTRPDPARRGEAERLADTGRIGFQSIREIEYAGEEEVYDLTVDSTHNFIANGMFCHNTSQSTPHVAALIACLLSDGVVGSSDDVKRALRETFTDELAAADPYETDLHRELFGRYRKSIAVGWGLMRLSRF